MSALTNGALLRFAAALCAAVWLLSCQSDYDPRQEDVRKLLGAGQFSKAAERHQRYGYQSQDTLLFDLNQSTLDYYRSSYLRFRYGLAWVEEVLPSRSFERTEQQLRQRDAQLSSFAKLASSSPAQSYSASMQEGLWQNVFASLYYWNRGSLDGALVELRRSQEKAEIYRQLAQHSQGKLFKKKDLLLDFRNSALMQYLGMIYYREDAHLDDWRINRDDLLAITQGSHYPQPIRADELPRAEFPQQGGALVDFCVFTGSGVQKVAQGIRILKVPGGVAVQLDGGLGAEDELGFSTIAIPTLSQNFSYYQMQVPNMVALENEITRIEVWTGGQSVGQLYPLEPLAEINMAIFRLLRSDFLPKQITVFVLKVVASEVAQALASEASGLAGLLAGLAGSVAVSATSPVPDLRSASFYPSQAWVGEIQLPPITGEDGRQQIELRYFAAGRLVHQKSFLLAVPPGKGLIVQDYYAR